MLANIKSNWANYVPLLYHQQWVAIENFRLWAVQTVAYVLIAIGVIYVLVEMPDYNSSITPEVRQLLWVDNAEPTITSMPAYCMGNISDTYDYMPTDAAHVAAGHFANTACAEITKSICTTSRDCLPVSKVAFTDTNSIFIATAYTKESFDATTGQTTKSSHIVPGIENITVGMNMDFQVQPPMSLVYPILGMDMVPSPETQFAFVNSAGSVVKQYKMDKYNRMNTMTVGQLIDMSATTGLDSRINGKGVLTEFPDNMDPRATWDNQRPMIRMTGMDLVLRADLANSWGGTDYGGLTSRITAQATPSWNTHTTISFTDSQGSTETRYYTGVRITLSRRGQMSWFQLNEVIFTWSLYSAWLQIPFYFVFYFAVGALGISSRIFRGFLYESVDLLQEFNGTSARMLGLTYGFHDLHDGEERNNSVWGVTRKRLQNRVDVILEHDPNLCNAERTQFTNFIFDVKATPMPSGNRGIHLEDYRAPHMAGENLLFKDVLQIVDSDKSSGNVLERLFMDSSLQVFSATAEKAEQKIMGKVKAKRRRECKLDEYSQMMQTARVAKSTHTMGRINTIARCKYGQEIADELMTKLEAAFSKMDHTCDNVIQHPHHD